MISIIVPCYNCEDTIDRCVESILNQTTKKYEIVLVNDGSVVILPLGILVICAKSIKVKLDIANVYLKSLKDK